MSETALSDTRAQYWQSHVDACHQSGLSKAQYCRDNDLAYHILIYWSTKLSGNRGTCEAVCSGSSPKLVPVAVSRLANPDDGLQLRLPNGVHVSGINDRSVGLLGRVIDQL